MTFLEDMDQLHYTVLPCYWFYHLQSTSLRYLPSKVSLAGGSRISNDKAGTPSTCLLSPYVQPFSGAIGFRSLNQNTVSWWWLGLRNVRIHFIFPKKQPWKCLDGPVNTLTAFCAGDPDSPP